MTDTKLWTQCHPQGIVGYGPVDAPVMLIGIAPGRHELLSGRPFTGQSGALMGNIMEATGYDLELCYRTNLLCRPYSGETPTLSDIMACFPRLLAEIKAVRPKLIVCLGSAVAGVFAPDRKFGEMRGTFDWHPTYKCWIYVTNHPAAVLHDSEARTSTATDLVKDLALIPQFLKDDPQLSDRDMIYCLINEPSHAQQLLDSIPLDRTVGIDIETSNPELEEVDAFVDELICLAISYVTDAGKEVTWVLPRDILDNLRWPADVRWATHYGTFDMQKLLKLLGIDLPIVEDSLLLHNCLEERSGRHKLKPLSRRFLYAGFYDDAIKDVKTNYRRAQPDSLHLYCAHDTRNTVRLINKLTPLVEAEGTRGVYDKLLLPAINVFKKMQYRGVPFSRPRAVELIKEWLPLYGEKERALRQMVLDTGHQPKNIDTFFGSPQQKSKFIYGVLKLPRAPGGTATATGKDVLEELSGMHPFIDASIDLAHLKHLLSTYVLGVLDTIKDDGRLHPSPLLHGTNGGRCSYSGPAVNTIPRSYMPSPYGPRLRKLFAAEPDHDILEMDYRQAELYMAYFLSGDKNLGLDLATGDFHRQTAAFIHKILPALVSGEQRFQAKKTNFGKLYRIGDTKLAKQIERPIAEAHEWSVAWDERYAEYVEWGERLFKQLSETGEIKTVTGRKFRYPLVLDRSIISAVYNGPIQATSHDYILDSIIEGYDTMLGEWGAEICLDIHDAIIIHSPKQHTLTAARYMTEVMERPRFGLPKMYAEVKIGPSWGEVKEIELDKIAA